MSGPPACGSTCRFNPLEQRRPMAIRYGKLAVTYRAAVLMRASLGAEPGFESIKRNTP